MMANFDPPQSHWEANFDGRLLSTFYHLKDRLTEAERTISELRAIVEAQNNTIAQGLADARAYARGNQ